mgnify:CR=1 FL=1
MGEFCLEAEARHIDLDLKLRISKTVIRKRMLGFSEQWLNGSRRCAVCSSLTIGAGLLGCLVIGCR